ncbi:phospholipase D Active site motif family protein [Streptococcus pyogenes]|uniref:cardiolipin synthase n=1 Tax=Streptococcus pyogenes TaxID=1314 RepID=UPI0004BE409A|nr:cardiolipin synthase [Streptococcus pyogenes]HER4540442.1 cardiolipin synthase [Streptococcus pyogenes NGAS719]HER4679398.1 cardiolipin synthase [Streptococcus pyogenes NGAS340]HER4736877.1 cardiolipin synthase [Streptococcus pyogenes NGAS311]HER4836841.1 cardiolipin synthase [Streptococcus pyogenes NGAS005]QCK56048.1 cardiolipin synthase [Streptococcus pyogenes]
MIIKKKAKVKYLLHKGKHGFLRGIFSRTTIIVLLIILQLVFLFQSYAWMEQYRVWITILESVFAITIVLYLVNSDMDAISRMTWLILIMIAPLLGSLFLIYTKLDWGYRGLKQRINHLVDLSAPYLSDDDAILEVLKDSTSTTYHLVQYLERSRGNFPIYNNTRVTYFPTGETFFDSLKEQLFLAKKYIFLEFFIIAEGQMWGEILSILEKKVSEGVEVRVLFDGMNELSTLSSDYAKRLEQIGIKAKSFLPISPFISTYYNYRDHRKIVVIDGEVSFTGGINLADEYINEVERFGHWKDAGLMLEGEATDSFLILFLQMWSITEKELIIDPYLSDHSLKLPSDGYVIPYGDSPLDTDKIGKNVYIDILNHAKEYVYIMTPYLILDSEMEHALRFASERGVDIRIIMPGVPDKGVPYALAKTYYKALMSSGVKIYEYQPGFVHSKVFISDNTKAVVGTINLDYRSLYHHFECATYLYRVSVIADIVNDFNEAQKQSLLMTSDHLKQRPWYQKLIGLLVRTIAPLL